jgi:phenylacetate-coenzyme A ligase PaaK-like adenylate-forming protein
VSISIKEKIFKISNAAEFNNCALEVYHHQFQHVPVYREFVKALHKDNIHDAAAIPFMPVSFFKKHTIIESEKQPALIFESSGTTGQITSKHYIADATLYEKSLVNCFRLFFGDPSQYRFLALLPSYLERKNSSLIYMVSKLISESGSNDSGFFLGDFDMLSDKLKTKESGRTNFLIGVSYALLDLGEKYPMELQDTIIMETGGMKGTRKEMIREELHQVLMRSFSGSAICSEYGMTELLSQAYSKGKGIFHTPPWMKVETREISDPLTRCEHGSTGRIVIADLANYHSCSFICTDDIGRTYPDGSFEMLGRMDESEMRGCNLMI